MDPVLDGDVGPEAEGGTVRRQEGVGLGGEFDEELGDLGLLGVIGGKGRRRAGALGGGGGGAGLAVVAGEGRLALGEARAAGVDPDATLVAADHLLAVVEGHATGAVHRPGAVAPVIRRLRRRQAVRAPLHADQSSLASKKIPNFPF